MPSRRPDTVVGRLKALTPQEFENFAYDLLLLSGMRNLIWRTPGADGGRDLEGEFSTIDFSGDHATQRWYIECKRYKSAIDWPTVHEKLAIAENHRADFLLFVTTANFSSPCRDEVDRRNKRGGSVRIRIWPFYKIDQMLSVHGQLAIKYGLRKAAAPLAVDFDTIITEITKLAQSTYAAATFAQQHFSRLELLAAFSELLAARTSDTRRFGMFVTRRFDPQRDSYDWCTPKPLPASGFDQTSLRAALAAIRAITGQRTLTCDASESVVTIENVARAEALRTTQLFALTETFGLLNASVASTSIRLVARKYDG